MSRIRYTRAHLSPEYAERLERERLLWQEEFRRQALTGELRGLRRRLIEHRSRLEAVAARGDALAAKAGDDSGTAPALATFRAKRQAAEQALAGFPAPPPGTGGDLATDDLTALTRRRDEGVRVLEAAERNLAALEAFLPQAEAAVAEFSRRKFETSVFEGAHAPPEPTVRPAARASTELATQTAAVWDLLSGLLVDSPPGLRAEVGEVVAAVTAYGAMRENPAYAAAQLTEMRRRLERLTRQAAGLRDERDGLRAEAIAVLDGLQLLAAERASSPDLPELAAAVAAGQSIIGTPWPDAPTARRWLDDARALAAQARSRVAADAQRHALLGEVATALEDLGYEVLGDPTNSVAFAEAPLEQVLASPHGGGVSVSVAVDGSVLAEVVRFCGPGQEEAAPSPLEADRLERQTQAFCHDYDTVLAALGSRGLRLGEKWRKEDEPAQLRAIEEPAAARDAASSAGTRRRARRRLTPDDLGA